MRGIVTLSLQPPQRVIISVLVLKKRYEVPSTTPFAAEAFTLLEPTCERRHLQVLLCFRKLLRFSTTCFLGLKLLGKCWTFQVRRGSKDVSYFTMRNFSDSAVLLHPLLSGIRGILGRSDSWQDRRAVNSLKLSRRLRVRDGLPGWRGPDTAMAGVGCFLDRGHGEKECLPGLQAQTNTSRILSAWNE